MTRRVLLLFTLSLTACGSVLLQGEVDGQDVGPAQEAIFATRATENEPLGSYQAVSLVLGGGTDTCGLLDTLEKASSLGCAEKCRRYESASVKLPDQEVWWLRLSFYADDSIAESYEYADEPLFRTFHGYLARWDTTGIQDSESCQQSCEDGENPIPEDYWSVSSGSVDIKDHLRKSLLSGSFNLGIGKEDSVKGEFDAIWCDTLLD